MLRLRSFIYDKYVTILNIRVLGFMLLYMVDVTGF